MKTHTVILACFLLFSSTISFGKVNNIEEFVPYFQNGNCEISNGIFQTLNDGQLYIKKLDDFEIRLKPNTKVSISKNPLALTDELELEAGSLGLKVGSDTLLIKTKFADVRLRNATVTILISNFMTRVCVLKGTAILIQKTNFIPVESGFEIAASKEKTSKKYKFLDDLRYMWYWVEPLKEPSLRD